MNSSLKHDWALALRSGKYIQGRGALRTVDRRYCAMGVLYDLIVSTEERNFTWGTYVPEAVLQRIGLSTRAQSFIAQLNDGGYSFEAIADVVDRDADLEESLSRVVNNTLLRIQTVSKLFLAPLQSSVESPASVLNYQVTFSTLTAMATA